MSCLCAREWVVALCAKGVGVSFVCLGSGCQLYMLAQDELVSDLCTRESALFAREWVSGLCDR